MSNKTSSIISSIALVSFGTGLVLGWDNEQLKFLFGLGTLISSTFSLTSIVRLFK